MIFTLLKIGIALLAMVVLYLIGAAFVRNFAQAEPPPEDPDPADLADVDYRYRCIVCGAQAVVYVAPHGEEPEPPRHCREPMALVTPVE